MQPLPALADFDDATFNPFLSEDLVFGDLADTYARLEPLRAAGPVLAGQVLELLHQPADPNLAGKQVFSVLSYHAIEQVLGNSVAFSNDAERDGVGQTFGDSLTIMNAPEHPRYRRIFQRIFFPGRVAKWSGDFIEPIIDDLVAELARSGRADLVDSFTRAFPFRIIYRQLGLPAQDIATFQKLAITLTMTWGEYLRFGMEASRKLGQYLSALLEHRRNNPGPDLVSQLAHTEVDGERLPDAVVISFLRQLLNAGGDTTYRATGTLLTALLTSPAQFDALKSNRSLLPQAIEEALRWDGPVVFFRRQATTAMTIDGVTIPAGAVVEVVTGAANRDPSVFDEPNRYDMHRERKRHFAFGYGPHVCVGQHLARLEMTHAMTALLNHFPRLRLDPDRPPPVVRGVGVRSPRHVYVRVD